MTQTHANGLMFQDVESEDFMLAYYVVKFPLILQDTLESTTVHVWAQHNIR